MARLETLAIRAYRIGSSIVQTPKNNTHIMSRWTKCWSQCTSQKGHAYNQFRYKSSSPPQNPLAQAQSNGHDPDTYSVVKITPLTTAMPKSPRSLKITTKNLSIEQILEEAPGTHARDFFSLSLTSVGEAASRKKRARYSVNKIHPWFVLPRETEIIVSTYTLYWLIVKSDMKVELKFIDVVVLRWHLDVYEQSLIDIQP